MLSKIGKFFTIGGTEEDGEEYQAIHSTDGTTYGTQPYMNDAIIESHNLSETRKAHNNSSENGDDSKNNKSTYSHYSEKFHRDATNLPNTYQSSMHASMIVHTGKSRSNLRKAINNADPNVKLETTSNTTSHHSKLSHNVSIGSNGIESNNSRNSNGNDTNDDEHGSSSRTHGQIDRSVISSSDTSSITSNSTDISNIDSKSPPLLGMILVTISAVCYAALNLSVKALMDETPWQELMIIRMGITWIATMIWILWQYKGQMSLWGPKDKRLLLTWRAFFLWGAMFCCWWSFEFLPVGDGTTLAMSFPVWVTVIAHFVFREDPGIPAAHSNHKLDRWGWICVFSGLIGVIFVAQPSFIFGGDEVYGPARDIGVILGLCSAVCAGAQYVIVNYTKEDCHWLQVEQITAFFSTFILMPAAFVVFATVKYYNTGTFDIGWEGLDAGRWCEEIALGLLGFCALALLTRGSQLDAPARTAICLYLQIPVTYAGQCLMTKTIPNLYVIIGIVLVLASVIVPAARKLRSSRRYAEEQEKLRQEEKRQRRLAREQEDLASDISESNDDSELNDDNDEKPLLDRYPSHHSNRSKSKSKNSAHSQLGVSIGVGDQLIDIPKYTINMSNSSKHSRKKSRRNTKVYAKSYNDLQSSSSEDSL